MKKTISLIVFLSVFTFAFAQEKNKIYIIASPTGTIYDYKGDVDGGGSYEGQMSFAVGLEYSREIFKNFELLTGVHYANNNIDYEGSSSSSTGSKYPIYKRSFHLNYISIPLQAKYHFSNFFFVNGGGIVNFKVSPIDENEKEKDKFGLLFGFGGKIDFNEKYCLIVNPFFQMNYLSSGRYMNFFNIGAKVGLGYKF